MLLGLIFVALGNSGMACEREVTLNATNEAVVASLIENADWLPLPNRSTWIMAASIPEGAHVTGAYVFGRLGDQFLIARHRDRGWDITGGHLDPGELPEVAAAREAREESGATIVNLRLVAYQKIEVLGELPAGYRYPALSYQALYVGEVRELGVFEEEEDMVERRLVTFDEAMATLRWAQRYPILMERAFALSNLK